MNLRLQARTQTKLAGKKRTAVSDSVAGSYTSNNAKHALIKRGAETRKPSPPNALSWLPVSETGNLTSKRVETWSELCTQSISKCSTYVTQLKLMRDPTLPRNSEESLRWPSTAQFPDTPCPVDLTWFHE